MKKLKTKKLLIFSEDTIYYDQNDTYKMTNPLNKLYAQLGKKFSEVILSGPVKYVNGMATGYVEEKITYSPRPHYNSVYGFFQRIPLLIIPTIHNVLKNIKKVDLVMIRLPSPLGIIIYWATKLYSKPCFFYIAGDVRKVTSGGGKYQNPVLRFLSSWVAKIFHFLTYKMINNSLIFVAGSELYNQFNLRANRCVNLVPSIVSHDEIHLREDTCQEEPICLLYVGRLVPVKGVPYLLEAIKRLTNGKHPVKLEIIGDGYQKSELIELAKKLGVINRVHFYGTVPFGPELFNIYRNADIFILPSISEGIPKTLLEAMSSGLPIVATHVGGIPDVIENEVTGQLIKPYSEKELASAIKEFVRNRMLRKSVIRNGYEYIKKHTIESQTSIMLQEISNYFFNAG